MEQVDSSDNNLNAKLTVERSKVTFSRVVGGKVVKGNGMKIERLKEILATPKETKMVQRCQRGWRTDWQAWKQG